MLYGNHVFGSFIANPATLKDATLITNSLRDAAEEGGMTILGDMNHKFVGDGEGVTAVVLLAESHISIHTWPETGYASFDVYTCGETNPLKVAELIKEKLGATETVFQHHFAR
jgi:S-adenosylmethionine decarboxylase